MTRLLAFAASHRRTSLNRALVKSAAKACEKTGATIDFAEYSEFDLPLLDNERFPNHTAPLPENVAHFARRLGSAGGILLAVPEYNWSFPGSLKNLIDWVSMLRPQPFGGKTAFLLSASPSLKGGAQALIQLKVPLEALGMVMLPRIFALSRADEAFNESGGWNDPKLAQEMDETAAQFVHFTRALAS